MSYARLRELFERLQDLDPAARDALLDAEQVEPALRAELEAMLREDGGEDVIAQAIDQAARRAAEVALPERIGPWRVLGLLGEGGMGTVLLAERADGEFEKTVAIKLIRGPASSRARERFRRERQLLAALDHPNIAALIDAGSTPGGEPYLVMEYVEGEALGDWLQRARPSLEARLRLFIALCRAVAHAHQHLVVHRDLKPSNILVRNDGSPVLLDFGIARLVESDAAEATASRVMTPAWASPEQLLGRPVTTATDVYALGLVLYELLTGRLPERGDAVHAATTELPPPSKLAAAASQQAVRNEARRQRGDLDKIARRAVRTEPLARYPSALALAADVDAWLDGRPVSAAGTHATYLLSRFIRRHRFATAAVGSALVAVVLFGVGLARERDRARQAEARATHEAAVANETTRFLEDLFAELDPQRHPGRSFSARELLDLGRERLQHLSGDSAAVRIRLQQSLGGIYASVGQPQEAIELLEEVRGSGTQALPPVERVRTDTALARSLYQLGRFEDALAAGERAVAGGEALEPPDDRSLAHALMSRGVALQSLSRLDAASVDYDRAQQLFERVGAQIEVASVVHNRAWLEEVRGRPAAALALYDQAYAQKLEAVGPDHPKALTSLHGRGKMLAQLDRYEESVRVREELVERSIRVHGPGSQPVFTAVGELASALQDAGRHAEAERAYERTLEIALALDPRSIHAATTYNNRGSLREERGDLAGAEADYRHSLELRRENLPEGHPSLAVPMHNLARLLLARGDLAQARPLGGQALALRSAALRPHHPLVLSSGLVLARIELQQGEREAARARLEEVEAAAAQADSPPAALRAALLDTRAAFARHEGDVAGWIEALRDALQTGVFPPGHPRHALWQLGLSEALLQAGHRREARALLQELAPVLRAQLVPEAQALQRLRGLEQALNGSGPRS